MPGQGDEVIFHHVGHRDKHEPMVADAHEATGQLATDVEHGHSDHVLNLDQEADGNGSFPSAYKFTNLFAAKLFGVAPHVVVTAALAAPDFLPAYTTIRNSSIAIVQMTRLRI